MDITKHPDLENLLNIESEYLIKRKKWFESHCMNYAPLVCIGCNELLCPFSLKKPGDRYNWFEYKESE